MSTDAALLPGAHVAELVRTLVKALRAFQMYLPNNPMYQRAEEALREAFAPVWAVMDEVALLVDESRILWEEEVVYENPQRTESFAWGLYKDGLRLLVLRKGVEEKEIGRFLGTVSRARLLPADAPDDLLTLLWEQEFTRIDYRFAEVVSDPWVYDPQALALEAAPADPQETRESVREEVAAQAARPEGLVDPEEFDSTLYFLDEIEIAALGEQVEQEYRRDARAAALDALFDVFELQGDPAVRAEVLDVLELLFPNLLARGDFRTVALILREVRGLASRLSDLPPPIRARLGAFDEHLSQPAAIAQLLQSLDEAGEAPSEADLGEVLRELKAPALGEILRQLPGLADERIRGAISAAAERLATRNGDELVRLLGTLPAEALPAAIQLAARLSLQRAIGPLGELARSLGPEGRLAAVQALAAFGTPSAMAALTPALDDEERKVRAAALSAVVQRSYAGALPWLEAAVTGSSRRALEPAEKRHAFEAFAALAGPRAFDVLRGILVSHGLFRRRARTDDRTCAVYALGRLRTAEARLLLEQLAGDKEIPVRHAVGTVLREWA